MRFWYQTENATGVVRRWRYDIDIDLNTMWSEYSVEKNIIADGIMDVKAVDEHFLHHYVPDEYWDWLPER